MTGARIFGVIVVSSLLSLTAATPAAAQAKAPHVPKAQGQKNPPPAGKGHRTGDWVRAHHNLTPEQQEKALANDPDFKKLPPDRQAEVKDHLRKFNSLPPQQRERALKRWEFLETLSPQQREQLRQSNQELKGLPEGRQLMVHKALRALRQMTPEGREGVFQSDRFHSTFSGQEQDILKRLSGMSPEEPETGQSK
ncbi:MAG TPA: DUF3106 domain-containing protein [Candidatus Saccharimonadales bacterium]|jgi:hypothetical protein|nr:DUF3106 domain-containing protein [Candidatus Saccharimonadales bacterium]